MNHSFFTHLLKNILVAFKFGHLCLKLPETSKCKFLCGPKFLTGRTYGKSLHSTKPLLRVAALFCIPSNGETKFHLFSIPSPPFVVSVLNFGYSNRRVNSCLSLHFPNYTCGAYFHMLITVCMSSLIRYPSLTHYNIWDLTFCRGGLRFFLYFGYYKSFYPRWLWRCFLPVCGSACSCF